MRVRRIGSCPSAVTLALSVLLAAGLSAAQRDTNQKNDHNAAGSAASTKMPQHFTALAINPNSMNATATSRQVDITIERWSTDEERDKLITTLREKGSDKLLDVLQGLPKVGSFGVTGAAGYDVHYARDTRGASGAEQITILTDRPIGFGEAFGQGRSMEYPFTLVELHLGPNGSGEGKLSLATKITVNKDTNAIGLEDYELQPTILSGVKRVS